MAKLESLIVDLQLNNAQLKKAIDDSNKKLDSLGDKVKKLSGQISLGAVAGAVKDATKALIGFVAHGAEVADATGKMAAAAGISTESFSRLQYAFQLGGVGAEEFSAGFARLNKNISEAATGGKEQAALFRALGVSVKDAAGNTRAADAVFLDLADAFNKLAPGADKAKLEMDLFGKTGARFESVFEGGAAAIRELGAEADRLGITISEKTAKAAQAFNDNVEKLELATSRVGARVAGQVAPAFAELTGFLLETKDGAALLKTTVDVLSTAMRIIASVAIGVGAAFDVVGTAIGGSVAAVVEILSGNLKGAQDAGNALNADIKKSMATAKDLIAKAWGEGAAEAEKGSKKIAKSTRDVAKAATDGKKAASEYESALKELTKAAVDMEAKVAGFDLGPIGAFEAELDKGSLSEKLKKIGDAGDDMRERLLKAFTDLKNLEANKLRAEIEFEVKITRGDTKRDVNARSFAHDTIGATPRQQAEFKTLGFKSFDDALKRLSEQTDRNARLLGTAQQLQLEGDKEGVRWALEQAAQAKRGAELAQKAADGYQTLAEMDYQSLVDNLAKVDGAMAVLGSAVLQAIPRLNQLVSAATQGAQTGGVWGALLAVIVQLISETQAFQGIINIVNGDLDQLIQAFEPIVSALAGLMGAFDSVSNTMTSAFGAILEPIGDIISAFTPLFKTLTDVIAPLTEPLGLIGDLLKPLAGILEVVFTLLNLFAQPLKFLAEIFKLLGFVLKLVMVPLDLIGRLFSWLAKLLEPVFKEIDKALGWLANRFQEFGDFVSTLGERIENAIIKGKGFKSNAELAPKDPSGPRAETNKNEGLTSEEPVEKDEPGYTRQEAEEEKRKKEEDEKNKISGLGDAAEKTAKSLDRLSAQFTNVPEGFKLNWRRFQATDGAGVSQVSLGAGVTNLSIVVQGNLVHERQLVEFIDKSRKKATWQREGAWRSP